MIFFFLNPALEESQNTKTKKKERIGRMGSKLVDEVRGGGMFVE